MRVLLLAVLALALLASPAAAATQTKLADVTIPASDGVDLVGDVYLPGDGKAKYPAVIDMEPYGRSSSTEYVDHGYARINTDVRGSGKSGGALCLLCLREQQDVYDVVEWRPGSRGATARSRCTATPTRRSPRCWAPRCARPTSRRSSSATRRPTPTATSSGRTACTTSRSSRAGSRARPRRRRSAWAASRSTSTAPSRSSPSRPSRCPTTGRPTG